ncbi:hypothetical protein DSM106972_063960 [Dulcicalothrix desertica PCC 7102]|uniref:Uncharacterized protein n=1 Tax=Dulcicalothrix desertica PCC 7102 TaxID=232991 RepID=A0A3S1AIN4_9CYAN|nr:hypothetical protein [Dulcicalothrix desertica]RUT01773.1 hypothetical protein DSM106972_063960 [Dulcicalothrix desertica PCC 7102]TWH42925.1 hypothetical protein CAL7102_06610 [Dulcicalothrix desertica PCC 7102]
MFLINALFNGKNFRSWQDWFIRERIVLFIGALVLTLGATNAWYQLPNKALETFGTNINFYKIGELLAGILAIQVFSLTFWTVERALPRKRFLASLIIVMLFPFFVNTWNPQVKFIASAYYKQVENVSAHVDNNFSEVQARWKQNIYLDKPEVPPSTFEISILDSRFFQLPSWDKIVLDGFGYNNRFFAFIGKGWMYTLIGISISLIGIFLANNNKNINSSTTDLKIFLMCAGFLVSLIIFFLIYVNIFNYQIDVQYSIGKYSKVVANSKILASLYPSLQGDEAFLERLARAEYYADKVEPALINFVQGLENYKNSSFQEAENYFKKALDIDKSRFLVRGYLASSILNQGVEYLNSPGNRKPGAAVDLFEKALIVFPGHIEGLYDLMLARVINGEFKKSADIAKKIIEGQKYFQEPRIGLLGQAYLHIAWAEYDNGDADKTWERYRQSVDSSTWKKSSVD